MLASSNFVLHHAQEILAESIGGKTSGIKAAGGLDLRVGLEVVGDFVKDGVIDAMAVEVLEEQKSL